MPAGGCAPVGDNVHHALAGLLDVALGVAHPTVLVGRPGHAAEDQRRRVEGLHRSAPISTERPAAIARPGPALPCLALPCPARPGPALPSCGLPCPALPPRACMPCPPAHLPAPQHRLRSSNQPPPSPPSPHTQPPPAVCCPHSHQDAPTDKDIMAKWTPPGVWGNESRHGAGEVSRRC